MSDLSPINHQGSLLSILENKTYVQKISKNLCKDDALKSCFGYFSLYKNITVFWDEDFDDRILRFIDNLAFSHPYEMYAVLFVYEHEGGLEVGLSHPVPPYFEKYFSDGVVVEGDIWSATLIKIYE